MKRRTILRGVGFLPFLNINMETIDKNTVAMPKVLKPKRLKEGDLISVIAPSSALPDHVIERAVKNLEGLGFKLKLGEHLREEKGYLAGSDAQRLADLHKAFADKETKAVWCIRGGYGAARLLPEVDFSIMRKNPKVFVGYSDITALHVSIFQKTGLVTFHGPVGTSEQTPYTRANVMNVLTNPQTQYKIELCPENTQNPSNLFKTQTITAGKCTGQLIGGNLSLLASADGTPYALKNLKGKILFIEDIDERPYRVDRMLTQLLQSHDLRTLSGIALGVFEGCNPKPDERSLSLIDCLRDRLGNLGIPVIYGLSFGHIAHQCTLPVGINAALDTEGGTLTLLEAAVS